MDEHSWKAPADDVSLVATVEGLFVRTFSGGLNPYLTTLPAMEMGREILRLAERDHEHEMFVAELIGLLNFDREALEQLEYPVGNLIVDEVRDRLAYARSLAERVRELDDDGEPPFVQQGGHEIVQTDADLRAAASFATDRIAALEEERRETVDVLRSMFLEVASPEEWPGADDLAETAGTVQIAIRSEAKRLEEENARLRAANREMAATCAHPDMIATQEGPLDA